MNPQTPRVLTRFITLLLAVSFLTLFSSCSTDREKGFKLNAESCMLIIEVDSICDLVENGQISESYALELLDKILDDLQDMKEEYDELYPDKDSKKRAAEDALKLANNGAGREMFRLSLDAYNSVRYSSLRRSSKEFDKKIEAIIKYYKG